MKKILLVVSIATSLISAPAVVSNYTVHFSGSSQSPPNASLGVGEGTVSYDSATHLLTLQAVFQGLTGTTTASHIHAATLVPFTGTAGVATTTPSLLGFPIGVTAGAFGPSILDLTLASSYNPSYITAHGGTTAGAEAALTAAMAAGEAYWNIHTSAFPGGEIRGFLQAVPEPTTTTLASSLNPSTYGSSVTFTSTVSPSAASGTVTFKDGSTTLGTGTLSSGIATYTTSALTVGSHSITAEYAGDSSYSGSTNSPAFSLTVNKATPTATLVVNNSPDTYDGLAKSATVGVSASSTPGAAANILTGGAASQTDAGTYAVTADFVPADTNYNTLSALSAGNFVIAKATPGITTWPTASAITQGQALSASTLTGGNPSVPGAFAWETPATVPPVGTNSQSVVFTPSAYTNYLSVTGSVSVVVNSVGTSPITPGNLVIFRAGSGTGALSSTGGNEVFLDEYTAAGLLVQSIAIPASGSGTKLITAGAAAAEGALSISPDGRWIGFAGYNTNLGTAISLPGSTAIQVPRVAGILDTTAGTCSLTPLGANYSAGGPRTVASKDGNKFWVAGSNTGILYGTVDGSSGPQVVTASAGSNLRVLGIFDNNLYAASASGTLPTVGLLDGNPLVNGLPTTNLFIPNIPRQGGSPATSRYGFVFLDVNPLVSGVDTLYVADDSGTAGGIWKYTKDVGGAWNGAGSITATSGLLRGITGKTSGTDVKLFMTGTANKLLTFTDTNAATSTLSGASNLLTTIATAGNNQAFRGVVLVGAPAPVAVAVTLGNLSQTYDGTAKAVTVTTDPTNITTAVTYDGSASAPTNAGSYIVIATVTQSGYFGGATNTLVIAKAASTNTLASSLNPSTYGSSVTFTSTVSPSSATGDVTFKDGAATLGTGALSGGVATYTTSALAVGSHSITAEYPGDSSYSGSTNSPALAQTVDKATPGITTWPTASVLTQGQPLSASTLTGGSASVAGGFAWENPATVPPVGTNSQNVVFSPTDAANYLSVTGAVSVVVTGPGTQVGYDGLTGAAVSFTASTPRTFMGQGFSVANVVTNPQITRMRLVLVSGGAVNYQNTRIRLQFWDTYNSASSPVFSNPAGEVQTFTTGPITAASPTAFTFTLDFASAIPLTGLTGHGFSVNWQGDPTGNGTFTDDTLLTAGLRSAGSANIVIGTNLNPSSGYYRNAGGETNFNFLSSSSRSLSGITNGGLVFDLTVVEAKLPTTITLVSSLNPSTYGSSVTFTSTVSPSVGSGTVTFKDGTDTLGTGTLSGGMTTLTTSSLTVGTHSITAEYAGDSSHAGSTNSPAFTQTVYVATSAVDDTLGALKNTNTTVAASVLTANDLFAPTYTVTITNVTYTGGHGGAVSLAGTNVIYTAATNYTGSDVFTYTITDGHGGVSVGTVAVNVRESGGSSPSPIGGIVVEGGKVKLTFHGVPNRTYRVQFTPIIGTPDWQDLGPATATRTGVITYEDTPPGGTDTRYYRIVYP